MTERLWPVQTGNFIVIGATGCGKTSYMTDLLRQIKRDTPNAAAAPSVRSNPPSKLDGDVPHDQ